MIKQWGNWELVTDKPMALVTRVSRDQDYDLTLLRLRTPDEQVAIIRHLAKKGWFDTRRFAYLLLALADLQKAGLLEELLRPEDLAREE